MLLSVKMLFDYCDRHLFLVSLATSVPKDNTTCEKNKRHDIFFNIKLLIYMSFLCWFASICKNFYFGKYNYYWAYHWMFKVFKLDQTVLNERVWWSMGIQQNQTIFEVNQTLSSVIDQSGTHTRKIIVEQNQTFWSRTLDGKYVNILIQCENSQVNSILVSFIISIFGVNSKINILILGIISINYYSFPLNCPKS